MRAKPQRRRFLRASLGVGLGVGLSACLELDHGIALAAPESAAQAFAEISERIGGRVGIFALDTHSGRTLGQHADERFAMCSSFKWLLAAAVLAHADAGRLMLDTPLAYGVEDLLDYAPVARAHLAEGSLSIEALARAAVTVSDNTAANLLLARTGGPAGLTAFARALGDSVTRLDRTEPELNSNQPGDPRDTTTPRAMVGLMRRILCGDALQPVSRARLLTWLRDCTTGQARLRAGFPASWRVGDKTGTGPGGALNDVAIAEPPGRGPILVAAYMSDSQAPREQLEAAQKEIAGRVAATL